MPTSSPSSSSYPPGGPSAPGYGLTGLLSSMSVLRNRYRILEKRAQGGMAAVYRAADMHLAGKMWAVKEMSDAAITNPLDRQQAIAAFQQEAQMLANLSHANLPKVTDYFSEDGREYLVMEFIEGQTLEEMLTARGNRPFSEEQVLGWAFQLCDVLEYLHHQGIIFRDLKPSNIMIDRNGTVRLIDFGIARVFKVGKASDTMAFGTPGYAPPELYSGSQSDVRSDVYSLGATLHTLLTGFDPAQAPFNLPPVRQLNPAVSQETERAITKALAGHADQRWPNIGAMRSALAPSSVPDTLERYPDISLPDKTVLQQPCALRVAVTQQAVHERFKEQKLALFVDQDQSQTMVDVLVTAPDFEIIGDAYRPLVVPRDRDSDPVVFQLIPTSEGEKPVKVEFFHDARYVGGVTVTTQVLPVQPMLQPEEARAQGRIAVVPGAPAPDLTILISEGRDEAANRRAYRFKLHAPSLGFYFYPIKEPLIFAGSPTAWMEGLYAELGGIHRTKSRERVAETLRTIGADLYEKLFPRELKELWKKRIRHQVRSILIVSDEPWIPWEIIRPSYEMEDGRTVEDDFLCETYLLARWIAGPPPPAVIQVQMGALIVPGQSGLRHAKDEMAFIRANLGNVVEIEPSVLAVWSLLKAGGFQLIHFICHARFDPERHEQSMLYLQNKDELKARDISGERRNFGKDRPFVFLNACQTARAEESLVGIGSWAEKFIGAESGGFLGSSWDVTDSLAARFSQAFYRSLLEGQTIGEAVHRARLVIKEDADPTWLAYALYADPLAKATFLTSSRVDQSHLRLASVLGPFVKTTNRRFLRDRHNGERRRRRVGGKVGNP